MGKKKIKTYSSIPGNERFKEVDCPVCASKGGKYLEIDFGIQFCCCQNCGSLYQDRQPLFEDLKKRYTKHYFDYEKENEEVFFQLTQLALADIGFDKLVFSSQNPGVLDIGCASGRLLKHLKEQGWNCLGLEICASSASWGRNQYELDIREKSLEQAELPDNHFDLVHASHLIEHLNSPLDFLAHCHRVLRNEGYLILTTPCVSGFQARLTGASWRSLIPDHLVLFSKKSMEMALDKSGFQLLRFKSWGGLAKGLAPSLIKKAADKLAKALGLGDVMVVLARKQ